MKRPEGLIGGLLICNVLAWVWAFAAFARSPALLGTALLAWLFGLRHAVDADHIAAIDNVVRKLVQGRGRPLTVGLWFSLGHSTVVVLVSVAVAALSAAMQSRLQTARLVGGVAGTLISAGFLCAIASANAASCRAMWKNFRQAQHSSAVPDNAAFLQPASGGLAARLLRPAFALITQSWQMYPLGFLFGLGFDTATEIGLLGISATQAAHGMPAFTLMLFPALFTAGMALVDTADSILMANAYEWAFINPLRKLCYNLTMTAASVLVAMLVGAIELLGLAGDQFELQGPLWNFIERVNDNSGYLGFCVVFVFAFCWGASALIYRCKKS